MSQQRTFRYAGTSRTRRVQRVHATSLQESGGPRVADGNETEARRAMLEKEQTHVHEYAGMAVGWSGQRATAAESEAAWRLVR